MRDTILILEDASDRLERFQAALSRRRPACSIRAWRGAHEMLSELNDCLSKAALISLDHDLYPTDASGSDPGDGLDVARALASRTPVCPVLIHSSNVDRGTMMQGELELAGWVCRRVAPIGADWIEVDWAAVVAELLAGTAT